MGAQDSSNEFDLIAHDLLEATGTSWCWIDVWRWLTDHPGYRRLLQQAAEDDLRWQGLPTKWIPAAAHLAMLAVARRLSHLQLDAPLPEPCGDWLQRLTRAACQDAIRSLLSCDAGCSALVNQFPASESAEAAFVRFRSLVNRFDDPYRSALLRLADERTPREVAIDMGLSLAEARRVVSLARQVVAGLRDDLE